MPCLKELGVHGVVTLNEPYETLVPTALYHVSVLLSSSVQFNILLDILLICWLWRRGFLLLLYEQIGLSWFPLFPVLFFFFLLFLTCVVTLFVPFQAHGIEHLVIPTRDYCFAPSLFNVCQAVEFLYSKCFKTMIKSFSYTVFSWYIAKPKEK